jgi:hypothetical protein
VHGGGVSLLHCLAVIFFLFLIVIHGGGTLPSCHCLFESIVSYGLTFCLRQRRFWLSFREFCFSKRKRHCRAIEDIDLRIGFKVLVMRSMLLLTATDWNGDMMFISCDVSC